MMHPLSNGDDSRAHKLPITLSLNNVISICYIRMAEVGTGCLRDFGITVALATKSRDDDSKREILSKAKFGMVLSIDSYFL